MAQISYTHCHHCGERLTVNDTPYCPPCNLYLAYRALPLLLGMLLSGHPALVPLLQPARIDAEEASHSQRPAPKREPEYRAYMWRRLAR